MGSSLSIFIFVTSGLTSVGEEVLKLYKVEIKYHSYKSLFETTKTAFVKKDYGIWQVIGHTDDGEDIELTTIAYNNYDKQYVWHHTPLSQIEKVLTGVNKLFNTVMSMPKPENSDQMQVIIEKTAEIHWWLAHAMPFERGSAAITEMLTRTILQMKGVEAGQWEQNKSPDCLALVIPKIEMFMELYAKLFQETPTLIKTAS